MRKTAQTLNSLDLATMVPCSSSVTVDAHRSTILGRFCVRSCLPAIYQSEVYPKIIARVCAYSKGAAMPAPDGATMAVGPTIIGNSQQGYACL